MSGLESIGVIVGILPLLRTGFDKYRTKFNRIRPFQTKKGHVHLVKKQIEKLLVDFTLTIEGVLDEAYDSKQASNTVRSHDPALWSDPHLQAHINNILGPHTDHFSALCGVFNKNISGIASIIDWVRETIVLSPCFLHLSRKTEAKAGSPALECPLWI
jgi:hypothetical protein